MPCFSRWPQQRPGSCQNWCGLRPGHGHYSTGRSARPEGAAVMTIRPAELLQHIRRLAAPAVAAEPAPDAALLERFVRDRDEAAFAALVARQGPMVLQLCRRVLGDAH